MSNTDTHYHSFFTIVSERGRSLIEMLSTLAIMGIIGLVGGKMYTSAINKLHANEILNEANKRIHVLLPQFTIQGKTEGSLIQFSGHSTFAGGTFNDGTPIQLINDQFSLQVTHVPESVCEQIKSNLPAMVQMTPSTCSGDDVTISLTYNEELKETCDVDNASSECFCPSVETTWTQPKLSENGLMGWDNAFACAAFSEIGTPRQAWHAFDQSNKDTERDCWHSASVPKGNPGWLAWYTNNPIKVSSILLENRGDYTSSGSCYAIKDYEIQYSDDNSTWKTVSSGENPNSEGYASYEIPVNADSFHQYWRLYITSGYGGYYAIGELTITATYLKPTTFNPDSKKCE